MAVEGPGPVSGGVRLGRVAGVPVAVNGSVLGIVALLAVLLATVALPAAAPGHSTPTYALAGLVSAVLVMLSLLAHETAHAVVARRLGLAVDGVTLWVLGGITRLRGDPVRPRVEARVAAAGPLTSGLLGVLFLGAAVLGPRGLVAAVLVELAWINVVLAVFNLLPAAPLDGGRVLHAVLWARTGDRWRAASLAATAGRVLGGVLVAGGVLLTVSAGITGLWLVLVGAWIGLAAGREEARARLGRALSGVTAGEIAGPAPVVRPAGVPGEVGPGGVLLLGPDGGWSGFLPAGGGRPVAGARLTTVPAATPVGDVLGGLTGPDARLVVVDATGRPVGTVAAPEVLRCARGSSGSAGSSGPAERSGPPGPPPADWWWTGGAPRIGSERRNVR